MSFAQTALIASLQYVLVRLHDHSSRKQRDQVLLHNSGRTSLLSNFRTRVFSKMRPPCLVIASARPSAYFTGLIFLRADMKDCLF